MMHLVPVDDSSDPRLSDYFKLTDWRHMRGILTKRAAYSSGGRKQEELSKIVDAFDKAIAEVLDKARWEARQKQASCMRERQAFRSSIS